VRQGSESRRKRQRLEELITDSNIDKMVRYVNMAFSALDTLLPAAGDHEDRARRSQVYAEAAVFLRRAALTYLREREPAVFNAIVSSAVHCARQAITTGEGDFQIVRPRKADTFVAALMGAHLLALYQQCRGDLVIAWRVVKQAPAPFMSSHFVSQKGRYGESQEAGLARRRAILDSRAQAVLNKARGLFDTEILRLRPLTKDQIARWLRADGTLSGVLHRLLGYLFGKEPRTIKLMLNQARKQERAAREQLALLEEKGWAKTQER